jgi:hypothetical protein
MFIFLVIVFVLCKTIKTIEWQRVPDSHLSHYFLPEEIEAVKTKHCVSGSWIGDACCTDGHTHAWFADSLVDTTPVRMRLLHTPPFVARHLLRTIRKTLAFSHSEECSIAFVGDSLALQEFWWTLCAFTRVGANVTRCGGGHNYGYHSRCTMDFDTSPKHHFNMTSNGVIMAELDVRGVDKDSHFRFKTCDSLRLSWLEFDYEMKWHGFYRYLHDHTNITIANWGARYIPSDEMLLTLARVVGAPKRSLIWQDTPPQHFYNIDGSGLWSSRLICPPKDLNETERLHYVLNHCKPHHYECQPITNITLARNHFVDLIDKKIISLNLSDAFLHWRVLELMAPRHDLHGLAVNIDRVSSDCTHYLYSPLFWDGLFYTLIDLIPRLPQFKTNIE